MFLMFILILMLVVNLMQSLKYVFLLTMVMRNLAIVFGMNKTEKSLEAENVIFNDLIMYKDKSIVVPDLTEID